jgi:DNA-binding CsgD family transcriptional regulator
MAQNILSNSCSLEEFEKSLNSMISFMPGYIGWKDVHSKFKYVNNEVLNIIGYKTVEEIIGLTDYDLKCKAAEHAGIFKRQDQSVLAAGRKKRYLDVMEYHQGEVKVLIGERMPLYYENKLMGLLISCQEITHFFINSIKLVKSTPSNIRSEFSSYEIVTEINTPAHILSKRETECLYWLLRGKSVKETAKLMGISPRTVETHMETIKRKLNCATKSELIEKAFYLGYQFFLPQSLLMR